MPLRMGTRSQRQNLLTTSGDYTTVGQLLQADPSLAKKEPPGKLNMGYRDSSSFTRRTGAFIDPFSKYYDDTLKSNKKSGFIYPGIMSPREVYKGFPNLRGFAGSTFDAVKNDPGAALLGIGNMGLIGQGLGVAPIAKFLGIKSPWSSEPKPVSPGFAVADAARGLQGKYGRDIRTILGGDPEHVFKEKRRLNAQIAANPFAAAALFGTGRQAFFGGGSFRGKLGTMRGLINKASAGTLSGLEKRFIEEQAEFGSRHGAFNRLLGRQAGIIAQRENVEAFRRRQPGRTQTILTTSR